MAVDGCTHLWCAALEFAQELEQPLGVVRLGEALAVHDAALLEDPVGVQEAIGGDEVDLRMVGPACEQFLEDAGEGALADGDAPGHTDHEGHLRGERAQEGGAGLVQVLGRGDVEVEQTREWQVHGGDLVEVDALVDATEPDEVVLLERQGGGCPQVGPFGAGEVQVAVGRVAHGRHPTLPV